MGTEIERKFLVNKKWVPQGEAHEITQGYLSLNPERIVRVRIDNDQAFLTIKGKGNGLSRPEYEYSIPVEEAKELLKMAEGSVIRKTRYKLYEIVKLWEVDVFHGDNEGLVVAECELLHEAEFLHQPIWAGEEVTHDKRYSNASLVKEPFKNWSENGAGSNKRGITF